MPVGLAADAERGDAAPAGAASLFGNNCQAIWHFFHAIEVVE
jgi:hypothetical protein